MRIRRPDIAPDICSCSPSHGSELHGPKGCSAEVVIFRCIRVGHSPYVHDESGTKCLQLVKCQCKAKNFDKNVMRRSDT